MLRRLFAVLFVALALVLASVQTAAAQSETPPPAAPVTAEIVTLAPLQVDAVPPITLEVAVRTQVVISGTEVLVTNVVISPTAAQDGQPLAVTVMDAPQTTVIAPAPSASADGETVAQDATPVTTTVAAEEAAPVATPTAEAEEASLPLGPTANRNANLRGGPGTNYPVRGGVKTGDPLEIDGRNADGTWYHLSNDLWIAAFLVDNAPADLPEVAAPPPPAPAPSQSVTVQSVTAISGEAARHFDNGMLHLDAREYGAAIEDFTLAIQAAPELTDAYMARGIAYLQLDNYGAAIADFNRVVSAMPNEGWTYYFRGVCHAMLGNVDQAISDLQTHLRLVPDSPARADVEAMLEFLERQR